MITGELLEAQRNSVDNIVVQQNGVIIIQVNDFDHVELHYGQLWYESPRNEPRFVAQAFTEDHTVNWDLPEGCTCTWSAESSAQLVERVSAWLSINSVTRFRMICALERSRIKFKCELLSEEIEFGLTSTH